MNGRADNGNGDDDAGWQSQIYLRGGRETAGCRGAAAAAAGSAGAGASSAMVNIVWPKQRPTRDSDILKSYVDST